MLFFHSPLIIEAIENVSTKAQQNKSASKNRYKTLNPFEAIAKAIIESTTINILKDLKISFFIKIKSRFTINYN